MKAGERIGPYELVAPAGGLFRRLKSATDFVNKVD